MASHECLLSLRLRNSHERGGRKILRTGGQRGPGPHSVSGHGRTIAPRTHSGGLREIKAVSSPAWVGGGSRVPVPS